MRGLKRHISVLLILVMGASLSVAVAQEEKDEIETMKHTASVIRMLTEYDRSEGANSPVARERLDAVISALRNDEIDRAEELFPAVLEELKPSNSTVEIRTRELTALFRTVLREAYGRDVEDLRYVADKVRFFKDAILIAERYIVELGKYREQAGDGEMAITTTAVKRRYSYGESPESMGSIRRLSVAGIDAEIERMKRQITDMDKQVESAVMQLQFAARRRIRTINKIVAAHDRLHVVLIRCIEDSGEEKK